MDAVSCTQKVTSIHLRLISPLSLLLLFCAEQHSCLYTLCHITGLFILEYKLTRTFLSSRSLPSDILKMDGLRLHTRPYTLYTINLRISCIYFMM